MSPTSARPGGLPAPVQALRLHQWAKNVLVWAAPIAAHRLADPPTLLRCAIAFLAFGLVSSGLYVVNDLHDLESDRLHPRKRHRPSARGALGAPAAWALAAACLGAGFSTALLLPPPFLPALSGYAAASALYTVLLKRYAVADALVLAGLYTARLYGGSFATGIPLTHWLAIFALFVFLSLALLKRVAELRECGAPLAGRDYAPGDELPLVAMGTTASYIAVLVLALYVASPEVWLLYRHPARLWALCPLVLFALTRLWILACRGRVADDPIVFAVKDGASWAVLAVAGGAIWAAS